MEVEQHNDHYATLGLSSRRYDTALTPQDIKQAYRVALLRYHPDKASESHAKVGKQAETAHSVDAITLAYKTLSDPALKAEYDRELRLIAAKESKKQDGVSYTGLDVVDLDDLQYDEAAGTWYRSCRCGQERGYIVTEEELEKDAKYGELITGCRGCSLWLKVLFEAETGDEG